MSLPIASSSKTTNSFFSKPNTPSSPSFDDLTKKEKEDLKALHAQIETTFARVIESNISHRKDGPFYVGYSSVEYMEETIAIEELWHKPESIKEKIARDRFHKVLERSFRAISKNYRKEGHSRSESYQEEIKTLPIFEKIWVVLRSKCGRHQGHHIMILEVIRKTAQTFDLHLVNIGYGAIVKRHSPHHCYDLNISNVAEDEHFYDTLANVQQTFHDVHIYSSILKKAWPGKYHLGKKRLIMKASLCATETLRRCYHDILEDKLYGDLMGFWVRFEANKIEKIYKESDFLRSTPISTLSQPPFFLNVKYFTPIHDDATSIFTSFFSPTIHKKVSFLTDEKLKKSLKDLFQAEVYYACLSGKTIPISSLSSISKKALGHTENTDEWHLVLRNKTRQKKTFAKKIAERII